MPKDPEATTDDPIQATPDEPASVDEPVVATPTTPEAAPEPFRDMYLLFHSDHGQNPDGDLEPLVEVGYLLEVGDGKRESIKVADELPAGIPKARIIPGTRIVHVGDAITAAGLLAIGDGQLFIPIDPPKKADIDKAVADTRDAVEKAGTFNEEN